MRTCRMMTPKIRNRRWIRSRGKFFSSISNDTKMKLSSACEWWKRTRGQTTRLKNCIKTASSSPAQIIHSHTSPASPHKSSPSSSGTTASSQTSGASSPTSSTIIRWHVARSTAKSSWLGSTSIGSTRTTGNFWWVDKRSRCNRGERLSFLGWSMAVKDA